MAERIGREPEQTSKTLFATGCACSRALKSRYKVDLRPLKWYPQKVSGVEDTHRSLQRRTDETEIAEAVATTLENPQYIHETACAALTIVLMT